MSEESDTNTREQGYRRRVVRGAVVLGLGIGGFLDGIVLHQVLQWHHMLTDVEPLTGTASFELNTLWDGLFHVFAYVCTLIGISLVWSATRLPGFRWSTTLLVGGLSVGWGAFNVVEGTVAALGGTPLALVYQDRSGAELRSTLAISFVVGIAISLAGLALAGKVEGRHVFLALELLPGLLVGLLVSRRVVRRLDERWLRPAVLAFAAVAGVTIVFLGS